MCQTNDTITLKNGIENPNLLPTHHFGIFSSRVQSNFKYKAPKKSSFTFNLSSGNNFHPYVEAYLPKDPEVRKGLSDVTWYFRRFNYVDEETTPADYTTIVIDAVIKDVRLGFNFPIAKKHELGINLRSFLITKGKYPFSVFTSDEYIEWFHSNIAGGEDPFGRRYYGLNQVNFEYLDRNGRTLKLENNDFFIGGLEINHFYYPEFNFKNIKNLYINFGSHLGVNTSKYNPSLDFGLSANVTKKFPLKNNYEFNVAANSSVLRKNLINFDDVIELGNNKFLATIEANLELARFTKKGNFNAFGVNYRIQSSYSKREESNYYVLYGKWQEIKGGWHNGIATQYKALSNWSFIYTYGTPKLMLSVYLLQDFLVNNTPDLQTGFSLKTSVLN